jgi:shikimate dehydrogenase
VNKVGVIGFPIEHSLSPTMHNAAFQALGMTDWHYDKMAIPPDVIKVSLREFMTHGFIGLNVTVPLKEKVLPYVKADDIAKAIGAVNTIDFRVNTGTNTDVQGFMDDLHAHAVSVDGAAVIVLGAGGAARADRP